MRKRVEGNVSILENADGVPICTSYQYGDIVVAHQKDWLTIKHMRMTAEEALSILSPEPPPGARFRFYGVSVELRSNVPGILDDFSRMYGNFMQHEDGPADMTLWALKAPVGSPLEYLLVMKPHPERELRLKGDFSQVSYLSSFDQLLFQVHQEAEVFLLTNNPDFMFIHGGTVERNSIGYMMPAESRQGKTTLTMALVQAGYSFMSDEFAVLDTKGTLLPFPRTLSMRADTMRLFPKLGTARESLPLIYSPVDNLYSVNPLDVFGGRAGNRCPVRHVIFPRYDPSTEPAMRNIGRMEAVRRLVGTQSYLSLGVAEKQPALDLLLSVLANAECHELITGDLSKTVALVDSLGG